MIRPLTILSALTVLVAVTGAEAKEYNERKHLAPAQQAKVSRVIATTEFMKATAEDKYGPNQDQSCEDLEIGKVDDDRRDRRPREQIIVTGDVFQVDGQCHTEDDLRRRRR